MARTWAKLATETEHYETVLFAQCKKEPCVGARPLAVDAWLEAGL
jgi:hypothetical protein